MKKCFRAGMKREAVQNERDRISKRPRIKKSIQPEEDMSINILQRAEKLSKEAYPEICNEADLSKSAEITKVDIADSIKRQLLVLIEWSKCVPAFTSLSLDDQVALIRAFSADHLIMGCAARSYLTADMVLLSNNTVIRRDCSEGEILKVAERILDQLCETMRDIHVSFKIFIFYFKINKFNKKIQSAQKPPTFNAKNSSCIIIM